MNNKEILNELKEFIDKLEDKYGKLQGFEVKLKHPVKDGETQGYADIEEFTLYYLHKVNLLTD